MQRYSPPPDTGIELIHHDEALIVVVKPSDLLAVPGRGPDKADCMAGRVQARFPDALAVHRLDMETSGLQVLAHGARIHRLMSILFLERRIDKRYSAVVEGLVAADAGTIDLPLIADWPNRPRQRVDHQLGKASTTRFRVVTRDPRAGTTRVELEPLTGRSHQLRVHLMSLGHPILGDALYGNASARHKASRLLLHAQSLAFDHPLTGEPLYLHSPPPF